MKNVTITINGKEYTAQMSDEAVAKITAEKKRTGYERAKCGEMYYYPSVHDDILDSGEFQIEFNDKCYDCANYYNDEQLAEDNARADRLMRRLRQWQALNDVAVDIYNIDTSKFYLMYDIERAEMIVDETHRVIENHTVYCSTMDKAVEMCKVFEPDLIWLHTQYRSRLDEPEVRDE